MPDFPAGFYSRRYGRGSWKHRAAASFRGIRLQVSGRFSKALLSGTDDSTEMGFKIAATMAFKQACSKAGPVLLEPVMKIEVVVPADYMGPVINDLNGRRGKVLGITARQEAQVVDAEAPLAEMFGYATNLRSLTQGRAVYTMQFDRYEATTPGIQEDDFKADRKNVLTRFPLE